jgi:hypothetical protein
MKNKNIIVLCAAVGIALLTSSCTVDKPQGKILSVTSRGFYLTVAATDSTTGTPKVTLGLGSQTVTLIPTSTNGPTWTAPFADSSVLDQTINPFSTSGSELLAAGTYQVQQTNTASSAQPVVPK